MIADTLPTSPPATMAPPESKRWGDRLFRWITLLAALSILVLVLLLGYQLYSGSLLSIREFG